MPRSLAVEAPLTLASLGPVLRNFLNLADNLDVKWTYEDEVHGVKYATGTDFSSLPRPLPVLVFIPHTNAEFVVVVHPQITKRKGC